MSVAMGRESQGHSLLDAVSESVHIAIPSGCFMEAFSALEDEQKSRGTFRAELGRQISQLRRDTTSRNAVELLQKLEESRIANDNLSNDIQERLFEFADRAAATCTLIMDDVHLIQRAMAEIYIEYDLTDNLILHAILAHAQSVPDARKALLTTNTRDFDAQPVTDALRAAGIEKTLHAVTDALGWLNSLGA